VFIWNTQRIQSANNLLSHTYLALAEHSLLFDSPGGPETSIWNNFRISHTMFYTRWSDHLGISTHTNSQNSHPFVSHIICGVIIWKSQSIQTLETRTCTQYNFTFPKTPNKAIFLPQIKKSYRDFLRVDSYNYEPAKTEWSQSWWHVFFLAYISLIPPSMPLPQELRKAWPIPLAIQGIDV